ncbi:uncharacterized protein BDZ99DRAFT_535064 [Mytilinidion resinicola]|uniref:Uncharacterized protein n=1 Tax=Mytilinidion resinicola TaxID=574789 RepID=A0A6A6YGH7_9PEZI|nr:uncharacterized protein BDZ99DRAFT_535064 [Mytilinidion resinicola]KAF2807633.1 hypothetical protein BDZ99DRAFT_535064 [Mytilinidion resinicola]
MLDGPAVSRALPIRGRKPSLTPSTTSSLDDGCLALCSFAKAKDKTATLHRSIQATPTASPPPSRPHLPPQADSAATPPQPSTSTRTSTSPSTIRTSSTRTSTPTPKAHTLAHPGSLAPISHLTVYPPLPSPTPLRHPSAPHTPPLPLFPPGYYTIPEIRRISATTVDSDNDMFTAQEFLDTTRLLPTYLPLRTQYHERVRTVEEVWEEGLPRERRGSEGDTGTQARFAEVPLEEDWRKGSILGRRERMRSVAW